jgi:hypothetical protein
MFKIGGLEKPATKEASLHLLLKFHKLLLLLLLFYKTNCSKWILKK